MKNLISILAAASALALAGAAQADTRDTNKDKATMEKNAAPSAPVKQEEERTGAHSQPDKPTPGGTSASKTDKPKSTGARQKPSKESPSTGSSAPGSSLPSPDRDAAFKLADMNGDGAVSKAEAAGNEQLVKGFDRADRNRDGKLTRAEYERVFTAKAKSGAQAAAR